MATAAMASSMSLLNPKCAIKPLLTSSSKPIITSTKLTTSSAAPLKTNLSLTATSSAAIAASIFATLSSSDAALAAQQIADLAEGSDNRGTLLLLVVAPAIGWVLFNILQPALNQINRMRSSKGLIIGLGLGALMAMNNEASAAAAAAEAGSDNRGTLLLLVVAPAIGWVLFNILQPALNQINRMRSD
ncbi:unnamed protein product [Rhodiola kirilowii]